MLIIQNVAAIAAGVERQTINKQLRKKPVPQYFIETANGYMIDDAHPLWLSYCEKIKLKQTYGIMQGKSKPLDPAAHYQKMGAAVTMILNRELDLPRERLVEILGMIDKEYENGPS